MEEVVSKGEKLKQELTGAVNSKAGLKGQFRGKGLICALEFDQPVAKNLQSQCTSKGLLVNAIGENILRLLPPLTISDNELKEGLSIIKNLINEI